eukprot:2230555-Pleurochrysis_carterae.AAC.9
MRWGKEVSASTVGYTAQTRSSAGGCALSVTSRCQKSERKSKRALSLTQAPPRARICNATAAALATCSRTGAPASKSAALTAIGAATGVAGSTSALTASRAYSASSRLRARAQRGMAAAT